MKNMSFIAFILSHTKEETREFITKKEARILPDDLSKRAKFLIGQNGKKKEDVFRETGLSRDYLYKVLRGAKKVKERDYILTVCLAAHLDLVDAYILLKTYSLPELNLNNERDVLLIHAINQKVGFNAANDLLQPAGYHALRTSPKDEKDDVAPLRFNDIKVEKINIAFNKKQEYMEVSAVGYIRNNIKIEYTSCNGETNTTCDVNDTQLKAYQYLLEGIVWQELAKYPQPNHDEKISVIYLS